MYYNQNYNSYPQSYPNSIYGSSFNPQMQPLNALLGFTSSEQISTATLLLCKQHRLKYREQLIFSALNFWFHNFTIFIPATCSMSIPRLFNAWTSISRPVSKSLYPFALLISPA